MNIQLQKLTGLLPEGEYSGTIIETSVSKDILFISETSLWITE